VPSKNPLPKGILHGFLPVTGTKGTVTIYKIKIGGNWNECLHN
jgi:hypothetical protein